MAVLMLAALSACGFLDGKLIVYDDGTGISVVMPEGMAPFTADGFVMAYSADEVMMSAVREGYDDYAELELNLEAMSTEEYAELTQSVNGLKNSFAADEQGNLFVTYTANIDSVDYFYYSTIRKGSDAFWVITFACAEEQQEKYFPAFEEWSGSITVN